MKPIHRHNARTYVLQALYAWHVSKNLPRSVEAEWIETASWKKADQEYFKELFRGVVEHVDELDALMQPYLNRPLQRLSAIELNIMRSAIYELKYRIDVPCRVVINEALELTKQFGNIEGFKFVNGVLDKVAKGLREIEART
ncbi:MAG: transcription antitermination factor NusB [Pseudomonadota bacterium]|nr:transcription antitermination factor NusB [Gammaproteobacteria bacterium]MBU1559096.1 transcription antitermination factor NusB [Gammaproteobacteria bacterium]MBU1628611.1 transcription antitermination factor NusB [Gammaproteobacteria bacterium]MBU1926493.1 transcription antitermination factor NusB [Gammaproteobacteria bacterium]MBU2546316.1 transcription antitermination factor NusB [Gammaproteobacteria bacterium]